MGFAAAKGCRGVCSICKLQGRAGRVKRRSVNAPLAYLMGGIRTIGFEGWVGFFFSVFPIDKHCFSCSSSHGEELIAFPPSLPLHPSTSTDGAGGPADDALQDPVWVPAPELPGLLGHTSFQLCILSFGEKSHCFPICRLGVRVFIPITSAGLTYFHCLWFSAFWEQ